MLWMMKNNEMCNESLKINYLKEKQKGEKMEEPNYVLKMKTAWPVSKQERWFKFVKYTVIALVVLMIVSAIFLDFNLFGEMSLISKILFIGLIIFVIFHRADDFIPAPVEIRFYNDHLVVDFVKHFYNEKDIRREVNTFYYDESTKVTNQIDGKRLFILGNLKREDYRYLPDGSLEETPFKTKEANGGAIYISYRFSMDVDLTKEIETHSPLIVVIEKKDKK